MNVKMIFSVIFSLFLFMNEISSFTVINNVTLNSDILKEIFFKEIQNNEEISGPIGQESLKYDSKKCISSLREIIGRFPNEEVFPFIDSWGHLPAGISYGNSFDTGEFDQCVKTSVSLNEVMESAVNGQYCFVHLMLPESFEGTNTGICVPDTCSPEYLTTIFKKASDDLLNGALTGIISVRHCTDGKTPPLTTINIVAISILSVVTALMILSSLYEFLMEYYHKTPVPVLLAFSVLTNGRKLFAISTKRSRNSIDCFNGIRVISTLWIMCHHIFSNLFSIRNSNMTLFLEFNDSIYYMLFIMATNAVNTFLFIGGLLVAFNGFRDLDKTKGKINVIMNVVHRYIRLTPIVAAGLLLSHGIYNILYTGPFRDIAVGGNTCDGSNWWPILLYIQNYFITEKSCYEESWYLAVDFQLYIFSPLLLISMWKWGKKIISVVGVMIVMSIAYIFTIFYIEKFTGFTQGVNLGEWEKVYIPTHTRWTPWLVGFVLGYFMHINRQTNFNVPKLLQLLGWIGSLTIMLAVIFGPFPSIHAYHEKGTVFEAAMYGSFKHIAWTASLVWITFACYYGYGGVIDTFLSHPIWQPFSRLTYALYMMHMAVIRMHLGMSRLPVHFSPYNSVLYFLSASGITLPIAIYVTLAFESPILVLEKFVFGGAKPTKQIVGDAEQQIQHMQPSAVQVDSTPKVS